MLRGVPPSKPWLDEIKAFTGIEETHPHVVRILEILRKKEAGGEITAEENKEFLILNDELIAAHEFIHGKKIYPSGEIDSYPEMPSRAQTVAAVNYMFDQDENEATAMGKRLAALGKQAMTRGILFGSDLQGWVQLAQGLGMDESHPALRHFQGLIEMKWEKRTWKQSHAAMNALLGAMEEAWKRKNSHP
jgi:hypothetical protein